MSFPDILVLALTAICLYTDLRWNKIYNKVVLPFAFTGVIVQLYCHGIRGLAEGMAGFTTGLLFLLIPFVVKQVGAGDVKLLATIGLIKGSQFTLMVFVGAAVAGGLMSCVLLARQGRLLSSLRTIGGVVLFRLGRIPSPYALTSLERAAPGDVIPFGVAVFAGVIAAYVYPLITG